MATICSATKMPAFIIANKLRNMQTNEFEERMYINARGTHPIIDELLTRNAIVIEKVIKAIFFSKNKKY
jgi:hypothetical protein